MWTFSTQTWKENGVEAKKYDHENWINQIQAWNSIGNSNIASITQYNSSEYFRQRYEMQKPLPSDNFNINIKNVIPSKYILAFDIQIKTRCLKWLK